MAAILADINIQGHVDVLVQICQGDFWREVWASLDMVLLTFEDLGLSRHDSDALVWRVCQQHETVLITRNRNAAGPESLEATIRAMNSPSCMPVFTIVHPDRILRNKIYADRVVERLLESLLEIDNLRGTGRIYLP
jgi:hypothetical protein